MYSLTTTMPEPNDHYLTVQLSTLDLKQTVEWDEMRFDVRLLQRVPYEGISRMRTCQTYANPNAVDRCQTCSLNPYSNALVRRDQPAPSSPRPRCPPVCHDMS